MFAPTSIAAVDLSRTSFTSASSGSQFLVRLSRRNPAPIRLAGDGYAVGLVPDRAIRPQGCRRAHPAGDRGHGARLPGRRRGGPRHRRGRSHRAGRLAGIFATENDLGTAMAIGPVTYFYTLVAGRQKFSAIMPQILGLLLCDDPPHAQTPYPANRLIRDTNFPNRLSCSMESSLQNQSNGSSSYYPSDLANARRTE